MEVFGHKQWQKYFRNLIKQEALGQAYLFYGPEGVGKRTFALELAKEIGARSLPDLQIIGLEPKEYSLRLEKFSDLKRELFLRPLSARYKVAVIDNFERATPKAYNSLLKILEQPPDFCIIICLTSCLACLPETVISRLKVINFQPLDLRSIKEFLSQKSSLGPQARQAIAALAGGRPDRALQLANQLTQDKDFIERAKQQLWELKEKSIGERLEVAEKLLRRDRSELLRSVDHWMMALREVLGEESRGGVISALERLGRLRADLLVPGRSIRLGLEEFVVNF